MHHPDAPPPARPQRLFPSAIPSASPDPSHPPSPSHPRKNGWAVYRYSLTHNHRFHATNQSGVSRRSRNRCNFSCQGILYKHIHTLFYPETYVLSNTFPKMTIKKRTVSIKLSIARGVQFISIALPDPILP